MDVRRRRMSDVAYAALVPQGYAVRDLGDMYVPSGVLRPPMISAAIATPSALPTPVHAVPVFYAAPQADARVRAGAGLTTPVQGVQ